MRIGQVEGVLTQILAKSGELQDGEKLKEGQKKRFFPIMLIGESGIGKSAIVKQVAGKMNVGCIDLRLATQEPGDLIGIPRGMDATGRTVWLKPNWWPEAGTRGILFLDELNRAPVEVRQAVFQLLTEWRMHEHILPDGWIIVSAINPEGKNGYQVEILDPAMLNRVWQIQVMHSGDEWLTWAAGAGVHKAVTGFISHQKDMLHKVKEEGAFPTPRSWEYVSDLLHNIQVEESCFTEAISGLVGSTAAAAFSTWMQKHYQRPVSADEILADYPKVAEKIKSQSRAANHATVTELASVLNSRYQQKKPMTKKETKWVVDFILDLPEHEDVRVAFLRKLSPVIVSNYLIGQSTPEAAKVSQLYNEVFRAAGAGSDDKKGKSSK